MNWDKLQSFDGIAIKLEDGREIGYRQLVQLADESVAELGTGDLAAVECNNSLGSLVAYVGCLRNRIPVMLLDASLLATLKEKTYRKFGFSVVFSGNVHKAGWHRRHDAGPEVHPDLALLLSTSGTTGSSKLVRLSHRNIVTNGFQIADYLKLSPSSVAISTLPMHYSYGLSVIHSHLLVGGTVALTNASVLERRFWDLVQCANVQMIAGVSSTFEMLKKLQLDQMNLPSMRVLTHAGGKMKRADVERFASLCQEKDWLFYVMYGQTEATARIAYLPPEELRTKTESVGVAVPGGRLELIGDSGETIISPYVTGEVVYYGDNVMMGYANDASDLASGDSLNGRLETGDLGHFDSDGFLYLKGRRHRFVKVMGHRVGLDELESHMHQHGLDVVITGCDELIVVAGLSKESTSKSINLLRSEFRIPAIALKQLQVECFPLTSTGKTDYQELLSHFCSHRINA